MDTWMRLITTVFLLRFSLGRECQSEWQNYYHCLQRNLTSEPSPVSGLVKPNGRLQQNLFLSNVRLCFKEYSCRDPLEPEHLLPARVFCFTSLWSEIRQDLSNCVGLPDLALPPTASELNTEEVYLLFVELALRNFRQYCDDDELMKEKLGDCAREKLAKFNIAQWTQGDRRRPHRRPSTFCQARALCESGHLSTGCRQEWSRVRGQICDCWSPTWTARLRHDYAQCLNNWKAADASPTDDEVIWLGDRLRDLCRLDMGFGWQPIDAVRCNRGQGQGHRVTGDSVKVTNGHSTAATPATTGYSKITETATEDSIDPEVTDMASSTESTSWSIEPRTVSDDETTTESDPSAPTTFFFQSFTQSPEDSESSSTSADLLTSTVVEPASTTTLSNNLLNILGLPNPFQGSVGQLLNFTEPVNKLRNFFQTGR